MSDQDELLSITDAAKRLGVHRNTIHQRIEKGIYECVWSQGPKGKQKYVRLASLEQPNEPRATTPQENAERVNIESDTQYPVRPAETIVSVLAPILERIADTERENGRLIERVRQLEAELEAARAEPEHRETSVDMSPRPWWRRLLGME